MQHLNDVLSATFRHSDCYPGNTYCVEIRFVENPSFDLGHDYCGSFKSCLRAFGATFKQFSEELIFECPPIESELELDYF